MYLKERSSGNEEYFFYSGVVSIEKMFAILESFGNNEKRRSCSLFGQVTMRDYHNKVDDCQNENKVRARHGVWLKCIIYICVCVCVCIFVPTVFNPLGTKKRFLQFWVYSQGLVCKVPVQRFRKAGPSFSTGSMRAKFLSSISFFKVCYLIDVRLFIDTHSSHALDFVFFHLSEF